MYLQIQGGDPTGKGDGGDSAFGGAFNDEIVRALKHDTRGVLSMANQGKNTNKSQLLVVGCCASLLICSFITFRQCTHLDGKHTIFGRVVGGIDTLAAMEKVACDEKDRPTVRISPVIRINFGLNFRRRSRSSAHRCSSIHTWRPRSSSRPNERSWTKRRKSKRRTVGHRQAGQPLEAKMQRTNRRPCFVPASASTFDRPVQHRRRQSNEATKQRRSWRRRRRRSGRS